VSSGSRDGNVPTCHDHRSRSDGVSIISAGCRMMPEAQPASTLIPESEGKKVSSRPASGCVPPGWRNWRVDTWRPPGDHGRRAQLRRAAGRGPQRPGPAPSGGGVRGPDRGRRPGRHPAPAAADRRGEVPGAVIIGRNVLEWRLDPPSEARIPVAGTPVTGKDITSARADGTRAAVRAWD